MIALFCCICTALAVPPVLTWTDADEELSPDPNLDGEDAIDVTPAAEGVGRQTRAFLPEAESLNGWVDEQNLVVSLSGDIGRLYYIMGTVRAPGLTAHWRQGPIAGENRSIEVPVLLPADLAEPLGQMASAHLSLRLAATTMDGRDLAQDQLARTQVANVGGRAVGGIAADDNELLDDSIAGEIR